MLLALMFPVLFVPWAESKACGTLGPITSPWGFVGIFLPAISRGGTAYSEARHLDCHKDLSFWHNPLPRACASCLVDSFYF